MELPGPERRRLSREIDAFRFRRRSASSARVAAEQDRVAIDAGRQRRGRGVALPGYIGRHVDPGERGRTRARSAKRPARRKEALRGEARGRAQQGRRDRRERDARGARREPERLQPRRILLGESGTTRGHGRARGAPAASRGKRRRRSQRLGAISCGAATTSLVSTPTNCSRSTERQRARIVAASSDLEPAVDRQLGDVRKPFRQAVERGLA